MRPKDFILTRPKELTTEGKIQCNQPVKSAWVSWAMDNFKTNQCENSTLMNDKET